jgi:hypothetical protein
LARAMRLSPHDPHVFNMQAATACAHFFAGRNSEAALWAEMARRNQSRHLLATCMGAASNALLGRQAEAEKVIVHLSQLSPGLRLSNLGDRFPIKRSEDLAKLTDALRKAGLPE